MMNVLSDDIAVIHRKSKFRLMKFRLDKDWTVNLCIAVVIYVYLIGFFTFNFGIPESAYYFTDVLVISMILGAIKRTLKAFFFSEVRIASILLLVLLGVGTFSAVLNGFHINLWIWSMRNWGRYFVYLYLCIALLDERKINGILQFTEKLFHINFFVILVQFILFYKKISPDAMNGLVGRTTSGVNMILLISTVVIVFSQYFTNNCSIKKVLCVLSETAIVSVLAELKALIFFVLILFLAMMAANFKAQVKLVMRYTIIIILLSIVSIISLRIIVAMYPYFEKLLSIDGLISAVTTESGYGNSGYIDRLTAVRVINKYIFDDLGIMTKLIGVGMGNAEYSSFSVFTSDFYREYGGTFKYLNFSVSSIYMEVGMVGLILFILIPVVLFVRCFVQIRKNQIEAKRARISYYENVGLGMTALIIMYIWYNNLQRTDISFLLSFYIAVPFSVKYHQSKGSA
ncbi:MAG: hypothetical protein HFJ42_10215 [Clostridia bacterium]|nr:hypothetical protein [Clostridia bacterium]